MIECAYLLKIKGYNLEDFIKEWGYLALFLYSFGGGFVGLVVAGVLAFAGDLNIYICIDVAANSNFLGDQFLFSLARNNKTYAKEMMQKYGRKVAYAHLLMRKYGSPVVFIQKYIYGIKTVIPLAMGLTKYNNKKFLVYNACAAIVWGIVVGSISYISGEFILNIAEDYKYIGIAILASIILGTSYLFRKI